MCNVTATVKLLLFFIFHKFECNSFAEHYKHSKGSSEVFELEILAAHKYIYT